MSILPPPPLLSCSPFRAPRPPWRGRTCGRRLGVRGPLGAPCPAARDTQTPPADPQPGPLEAAKLCCPHHPRDSRLLCAPRPAHCPPPSGWSHVPAPPGLSPGLGGPTRMLAPAPCRGSERGGSSPSPRDPDPPWLAPGSLWNSGSCRLGVAATGHHCPGAPTGPHSGDTVSTTGLGRPLLAGHRALGRQPAETPSLGWSRAPRSRPRRGSG